MAKAKESVQEMVDEYKQLTVDGDPDLEGEALLTKIVKTRDPQAIELLLTLHPTEADWNSDEINEVASALQNAPEIVRSGVCPVCRANLPRYSAVI